MVDKGIAKPICPEILGGLSTPRNPAEIVGGDGFDVLENRAKIIDSQGNDVTKEDRTSNEGIRYLSKNKLRNINTKILQSNL
ncbi:DUF523 domain-containing protein [Staphylococcus hominis]